VLAENLVRRCDPASSPIAGQLIERKRDLDFPWFPARVVCHDILGQTALVDLAGLRDAIAEQGGDPAQVNPVVPVQLIVDHSLAVECGGYDPDAFEKNRAIEDRRNEDRFHFIDWTKKAFKNVDVIPPGNGIMHQINLERMSPVIQVQRRRRLPDTCVGTDSHTPHVDALGVIADRRRRPGGRERDARPRLVDAPARHRRRRADRQAQPGITATDIVLALTEFLRKSEGGGRLPRVLRRGRRGADARRPRDDLQHGAGVRRHRGDVLHRPADARLPALTGRDRRAGRAGRDLREGTAGLWADALAAAEYERVLSSTCRASCATWPARPTRTRARDQRTAARHRRIWTRVGREPGLMPDGAVIIAAITSCTNTSNPRNVIAAGLLARNANRAA
jgi:2-methylcitrate dehydratase (2-methyl-trans-aconitate forming)